MSYTSLIHVNPALSDCALSKAQAMRLPIIHGRADRDFTLVGFTLADATTFQWAQHFSWHLDAYGYVARRRPRPARGSISLHREILGLTPGDARLGDHVNRDILDNRRSNLRILVRAHHNHNMGSHRDSKYSDFRGVSYRPDRGKWRAYGKVSGKWQHVGYFLTEVEAAEAARAWRFANMQAAID